MIPWSVLCMDTDHIFLRAHHIWASHKNHILSPMVVGCTHPTNRLWSCNEYRRVRQQGPLRNVIWRCLADRWARIPPFWYNALSVVWLVAIPLWYLMKAGPWCSATSSYLLKTNNYFNYYFILLHQWSRVTLRPKSTCSSDHQAQENHGLQRICCEVVAKLMVLDINFGTLVVFPFL